MEPVVARAILERRGLYGQGHRPDLPARQREVLLLEYFGFEGAEIARLFGTSKQTVKNQAHQAHAAVVPPPLPSTHANASVWTGMHRGCCMASAFAMIEVLATRLAEKTKKIVRQEHAVRFLRMPECSQFS